MTKSQSLILNLILNWHLIFQSFMVHSKSPMSMASKPPEKTRRWERCKWTAKGAKGDSRWAYRTKSRHQSSESQRKHDLTWHVWLNILTWLNIFYHFDVKFDFPKVWFFQGSVLRSQGHFFGIPGLHLWWRVGTTEHRLITKEHSKQAKEDTGQTCFDHFGAKRF